MTADMLQHLGSYLRREYGERYRVERFDLGVWDAVAHIVATDGSRWPIHIEAAEGCRWEDSTITDPASLPTGYRTTKETS